MESYVIHKNKPLLDRSIRKTEKRGKNKIVAHDAIAECVIDVDHRSYTNLSLKIIQS